MSISNIVTILASGVQARGTCANPFNNSMLLIDSSNGLIRQYDLTTYARFEPYCYLSNTQPIGIAMCSSSSAIISFSGLTAYDLVELSTGHRVTGTLPNAAPSQSSTAAKGQQIAADPTNRYALFLSSTNALSLLNLNSPGIPSGVNLPVLRSGSVPSSVILKETGRFLVGTSYGELLELGLSGTVISRMILSNSNTLGNQVTVMNPRVVGMAYDNNLLLVSTEVGIIYVIDWSTLTILRTYGANNTPQGILLSDAASGVALASLAPVSTRNKCVVEVDFTVAPASFGTQPFFLNSGTQVVDIGINPNTGRGWVVQQTTTSGATTTATIFFFDSSTRATRLRTTSVTGIASTSRFRLIIIDRDNYTVYLDTLASSPATYRVPEGKNIIEVVKLNDGTSGSYSLVYDVT